MTERVQIAAGDVIEVQLTSETVVVENQRAERRRGRKQRGPVSTGRISNRMRVFLRDADGKEDDYDLEGARIGVREGHRAAIARGAVPGVREPINLVLINISTDERDVFERNMHAFLYRKPFFGPLWKAFGLAVLLTLFGIFYSQIIMHHAEPKPLARSFWLAAFFSFLAYPVLWWLTTIYQNVTESMRYKKQRTQLLADIDGRLRAFQTPTSRTAGVSPAD
jgi:hypothetical protein